MGHFEQGGKKVKKTLANAVRICNITSIGEVEWLAVNGKRAI